MKSSKCGVGFNGHSVVLTTSKKIVTHRSPGALLFEYSEKLFLVSRVFYIVILNRDFNLGQRRMVFFEDCQATALTTWPPRPVSKTVCEDIN